MKLCDCARFVKVPRGARPCVAGRYGGGCTVATGAGLDGGEGRLVCVLLGRGYASRCHHPHLSRNDRRHRRVHGRGSSAGSSRVRGVASASARGRGPARADERAHPRASAAASAARSSSALIASPPGPRGGPDRGAGRESAAIDGGDVRGRVTRVPAITGSWSVSPCGASVLDAFVFPIRREELVRRGDVYSIASARVELVGYRGVERTSDGAAWLCPAP